MQILHHTRARAPPLKTIIPFSDLTAPSKPTYFHYHQSHPQPSHFTWILFSHSNNFLLSQRLTLEQIDMAIINSPTSQHHPMGMKSRSSNRRIPRDIRNAQITHVWLKRGEVLHLGIVDSDRVIRTSRREYRRMLMDT
jgi:hypothetical protein